MASLSLSPSHLRSLLSMPRPVEIRKGATPDICSELRRKRMALQVTYDEHYHERRSVESKLAELRRNLWNILDRINEARRHGDEDRVRRLKAEMKRMEAERDRLIRQKEQLDSILRRLDGALKEIHALEVRNGCSRLGCAISSAGIEHPGPTCEQRSATKGQA